MQLDEAVDFYHRDGEFDDVIIPNLCQIEKLL